MVRNISAFLLVFLFFGCKDPKLISPLYSLDNNIKLNGYFYKIADDKLTINAIFIYRNGVIFDCFDNPAKNLIDLDSIILNENILQTSEDKKNKLTWGIFNLKNNLISCEQWFPSSGGPMPVYIRKGKILNDSTFNFTSIEKQNGKNKKKIDETYHFRTFSPKLDSTNKWIK